MEFQTMISSVQEVAVRPKRITRLITLTPENDTTGGHTTTNCPASAGRWECAPDRGAVAIGVNGVPIFGPEEGPGGDAVALHFDYFNEDRQPIELGLVCGALCRFGWIPLPLRCQLHLLTPSRRRHGGLRLVLDSR